MEDSAHEAGAGLAVVDVGQAADERQLSWARRKIFRLPEAEHKPGVDSMDQLRP
jgi:hypothetical protein